MAYQNQNQAPVQTQAQPATDSKAVVVQKKYNYVQEMFSKYKGDVANILPSHLTPERIIHLALSEFRRNDKLHNCDPRSFVNAVFMASRIGLEIGVLGLAHIVPYGTECQLIPGYKGLIDLAMRDGKVRQIYARCVYEKDEFDYISGTEERIIHKPCLEQERGNLRLVYAVAIFHDGHALHEVMTRADVEHVRKSSKGYRPGYDTPWVTHEAEMWKKTVIRRICKTLPQSIELNTALALADAENTGKLHKFELSDVLNSQWIPAVSNDDPNAIDVSGSNEPTASEKAAAKARERINNTVGNKAATSAPVVEAEPADDNPTGLC